MAVTIETKSGKNGKSAHRPLNRKPEGVSRLLTAREVANLLGVKPGTLSAWRCKGTGPRFVKLGGLSKYREDDLKDWMREQGLL